jgi:hypothetical protein
VQANKEQTDSMIDCILTGFTVGPVSMVIIQLYFALSRQ